MVDLDKIVRQMKKQSPSISLGSDMPEQLNFVSTGNKAFDLIADGGVPFGVCIEFLGLSQSGKSLFLQMIMSNAQRDYDAIGILVDRENAYTKTRGVQLGINNDKLIHLKPQDVPTIVEAAQNIIDIITNIRKQEEGTGEKSFIVAGIDSIAAFGKDVILEKSDAGRKAKMMHESLRELLTFIDDHVMLILLNQVTYKIGVLYGDPQTSSSGEGPKYYSSVRFALEDRKQIIDTKRNNEVIGNWIGVEVIKTRFGPSHRKCYLRHLYSTGIDYYSGYARLLATRNYMKPKNASEFKSFKQSTLVYKDKQISEHKVESILEEYPELLFDTYPPWFEDGEVVETIEGMDEI